MATKERFAAMAASGCAARHLDTLRVGLARRRVQKSKSPVHKRGEAFRKPVRNVFIPSLIDQNPCAQSRNPMDMIRQG